VEVAPKFKRLWAPEFATVLTIWIRMSSGRWACKMEDGLRKGDFYKHARW